MRINVCGSRGLCIATTRQETGSDTTVSSRMNTFHYEILRNERKEIRRHLSFSSRKAWRRFQAITPSSRTRWKAIPSRPGEQLWLTKVHNTGNIANFLALIVAARKHMEAGRIPESDYVALLKALECFAYRVFLYDGRRSNAGKSNFHRWASEIFNQTQSIRAVTAWVHNLTATTRLRNRSPAKMRESETGMALDISSNIRFMSMS